MVYVCSFPVQKVSVDLETQTKAAEKGALDGTCYGEAHHSPRDFVTHHIAAISAAVQLADTLTIRNAAAALQFSLSMSPGK